MSRVIRSRPLTADDNMIIATYTLMPGLREQVSTFQRNPHPKKAGIEDLFYALAQSPAATLLKGDNGVPVRMELVRLPEVPFIEEADQLRRLVDALASYDFNDEAIDWKIWKLVFELPMDNVLLNSSPSPSSLITTNSSSSHGTTESAVQQNSPARGGIEPPRVRKEFPVDIYEQVRGLEWICSNVPQEVRNAIRNAQTDIFEKPPEESRGVVGCSDIPSLWRFINGLQHNEHMRNSPNKFFANSEYHVPSRPGEWRFMLLLMCRADLEEERIKVRRHVCGVAQLTSCRRDLDGYRKIPRIARYAREMFSAQPSRLFFPTLFITDKQAEIIIFDRVGIYSSVVLDIIADAEKFVDILAGFLWSSKTDLGHNPYITSLTQSIAEVELDEEDPNRTPTTGSTGSDDSQVSLQTTIKNISISFKTVSLISQTHTLHSRGTAVFHPLEPHPGVLKLSWTDHRGWNEIAHLRALHRRSIPGLPTLLASRILTTTPEIHANLDFSSATKRRVKLTLPFDNSDDHFPDPLVLSPLTLPSHPSFPPEPRRLTVLSLSPLGQPLELVPDARTLVLILRDAVVQHRAALNRAGILHRDISENNILWTDPSENDGCTGMLIDWDLAIRLDDLEASRVNSPVHDHVVGSKPFMALELLEYVGREDYGLVAERLEDKVVNRWRHDLEGFFWVLVWVGLRFGWSEGESRPREVSEMLRFWNEGPWAGVGIAKGKMLDYEEFEEKICGALSPKFEGLEEILWGLRGVLFCHRDVDEEEGFYVGTPEDREDTYERFLEVLETRLEDM